MPTSEARILANRNNSLLSTGPKTAEGKARSRCNALQHGLTGEGVALPSEEAAEVDRQVAAMTVELKPATEVGKSLVRRLAILSVRLDRCVSHETAALSQRVRQATADFQAPEGLDGPSIAQLRAEAQALALFDPSREATLARKYEAAAERGFFRALKEFRQVEAEAKAAQPEVVAAEAKAEVQAQVQAARKALASFMPVAQSLDLIETLNAERARPASPAPSRPASNPAKPTANVGFAIGRAG